MDSTLKIILISYYDCDKYVKTIRLSEKKCLTIDIPRATQGLHCCFCGEFPEADDCNSWRKFMKMDDNSLFSKISKDLSVVRLSNRGEEEGEKKIEPVEYTVKLRYLNKNQEIYPDCDFAFFEHNELRKYVSYLKTKQNNGNNNDSCSFFSIPYGAKKLTVCFMKGSNHCEECFITTKA